MTTNKIDLPSSLKGEIQLATMTIVVAKTTTMIVVIVAIVARSIILVAKINNSYFTSPIWSLCKFSRVFVQKKLISTNVNSWKKQCHAKVYWGGNLMLKMLFQGGWNR
jgi:hypothetical protein